MVRSGSRIEVVESASGTDITNIVLVNAIIDRDPARILSISPDFFHGMIKGSSDLVELSSDSKDVNQLRQELFAVKSDLERLNTRSALKAS